ncbi:hypothetical protein RFI_06847 [Reticulomyxa filosa]|uniref:Endonuclease/exonuclease/phosphatase domain-containing protein n=1 Tax=Reticulomyxa filosa TaxID=46433 RepID=X6NWA7_RETFI|nr:hypothetical protein RFI_06847 [Reticulomyxa filosa]|eukprot:ETO30271.1 hypothetical protein RFI_06847 [Reticulomyxa filosa]
MSTGAITAEALGSMAITATPANSINNSGNNHSMTANGKATKARLMKQYKHMNDKKECMVSNSHPISDQSSVIDGHLRIVLYFVLYPNDEKRETFGDAIIPVSQNRDFVDRNINTKLVVKKREDETTHSVSLEEAMKLPPDHQLQHDIGRGILKKTFLPVESLLNMKKINLYQPTFKRRDWSIDYVLVNFPVSCVKNYTFGKRGGLSDHFLIITEFSMPIKT